MDGRTHSIWISEQLQELGHEVIVANVRELRAISHIDRKSDHADAEKLARYARRDQEDPASHFAPVQLNTGSTHADLCTRSSGEIAHSRGERGARTDEAMWLSP